MTKEYIENFTGENVKITMINNATFEGVLCFVRFENEDKVDIHSINLDTYDFYFLSGHLKNIEILP